jgi:hypothetical protein
MPGSVMRWMARAAFIGALGTPADAADLSPPSPSHHRPHGLVGHLPRAPSDHVPAVAPGRVLLRSQADEHAGNPVLNWGANTTFDGPSVSKHVRLGHAIERMIGLNPVNELFHDLVPGLNLVRRTAE